MVRSLTPRAALAALLTLATVVAAEARDWTRFRGPNGAGVSLDEAPPVEWSDTKNLAWKVDLPGPGSSCPIVVGDKLFVTCWTGYGLSREEPGDQSDLKRSLLCFNRETGDELWRVEVDAKLPEDEFGGMFAEHGYASHTPVSDGERVYVYFGKTGALAYDMEGNELWRTDCGDGSGIRGWGSASSPVLSGDLVICAATAESRSLIALNKKTGKEVWRHTEDGWDGVWGSPVLVEANGRTELVFAVPFKVLALDLATGDELWSCRGVDNDSVSTSLLAHDDVVYILAGRGGSLAVRAGGDGEVDDTNVLWRAELQGSIATPVFFDGRLYGVGRAGVNCYDAATGDRVYQERFVNADAPAPEEAAPEEAPEGRRGRRGRGGFGSMPYSSPVVVGDLFCHFGRDGVAHVVRLGEEYDQVARNVLTDGGDFSATPALSEGAMYVRSSKCLYCIRSTGESVAAR
ncbi:outer membrane biogenesis protein BamB [Botrimarina colliarenosi]|uniref:Outer membrane biogenesis protein BamB n=1 Tax=Botrimarina colliarenosi TaxID=2528001 RepID=A0A5C6ABQ1_9BACT|nr:PQQ-binding-like beta-propeller repeat protein [Botrimarina colliarenosi]TWT96738.1 outer membrane biogenesis protein BamB [Botrimarina colliarenosi]